MGESTNIGKRVIVRGTNSGLFYGTLASRDGSEVKLTNCRRLWYWEGAASDFQIALDGVSKPKECKFTVYVESIEILDAIEVLPCSDKAIKSIESVKEWAC